MKTENEKIDLYSSLQSNISESFDKKKITTAVLLCIGAVGLVLCGAFCLAKGAMLQNILFVLCSFMIIIAGYYVMNSRIKVLASTGSHLIERAVFFELNDAERMKKVLDEGGTLGDLNLSLQSNGKFRLDYLCSEDGQLCAVQIMEFVPYYYQPFTAVYHLREDQKKRIEELLKK
ncbi:MAG: hypothetical protein RR386_02980 [Bacteroidaceae bacterium]